MKIIDELNKKMIDFHNEWEEVSTEETFLSLSASDATKEFNVNYERYDKLLFKISEIFNNEKNFKLIIDNWNLIDLKMLDILISYFSINIDKFIEKIKVENVSDEIKDFILLR